VTCDALARVLRGFVTLPDCQVHYRTASPALPERDGISPIPLVMLHASPGSAKLLEPLIARLGNSRAVYAPDTLGNGDSSAPVSDKADIRYFAQVHVQAIDQLGIERFDLYGSHTGANIACEIAIAHPGRVRKLILDGVSQYTDDERDDMLKHYAPGVAIDMNGSQLAWIYQFVRDVYLFWPWYKRDAAHRRSIGLPSADELHDKAVEVIKATRTYHIPYRAAIGYDKTSRLPLVRVPTLLACAQTDMFLEYFDRICRLMPEAQPLITAGTGNAEALENTVAQYLAFLDAQDENTYLT
jgi:pimeloyl-ACP methyl ester carboxylesterase